MFPIKTKENFYNCKKTSLINSLHVLWIRLLMKIGVYIKFLRPKLTLKQQSWYINEVKQNFIDLRSSLRINELPIIPTSKYHTHPNSACERTGTSNAIANIIKIAGYEPYFVSMANSDQVADQRGCRYYYWPKDLKADYRDDQVNANDILVFIDVDFHCDMNEYLKLGNPIIMYTIIPDQAACQDVEHSYKINNNEVIYRVSGGAEYKHQIWDYDYEIIAVDDDSGWTIFYNVEHRKIDGKVAGGRSIVTLLPFVKIPTYCSYNLNPVYLKRKIFTVDGINKVYNDITDDLSISLNNSYNDVKIKGRRFEALRQRLLAKNGASFTIGDIEQYIYDDNDDDVKIKASHLYSIFKTTCDIQLEGNVIKTSHCQYTPIGPMVMNEVKPACTILTTPIVANPALFPTKTVNSEIAAISGRIERVKNDKIPNRTYVEYANEFVNLLVRTADKGLPITTEEVIALQNRPMQRARIERERDNIGVLSKNRLKTFNKAEAYGSANDPRIITTCDPKLTTEMSRFTYAFKRDILKKLSWYGPGHNPNQSIKRLRYITRTGAIETDFSRFDGSISKFLQEHIVFHAYTKWVNNKEKKLMLHYLQQVFIKRGKTSSNIKYSAGWGTRSGSPITTDGNTMINAYISFAALRNLGYSKRDAYHKLGLYAGDDGINTLIDGFKDSIEAVCIELGLDVKISAVDSNQPITYLSRIFPSIQTHDDSHQDLIRTLPKIHLSANKNVSREQAAVNKAVGYLTTDSKTPIISEYCNKVLELCNIQPKNLLSEELFKIENGAWPQHNHSIIKDSVKKTLGMNEEEIESKLLELSKVKDLDSFPVLYNNQFEIKIASVIGDSVNRPRIKNTKRSNGEQSNEPNKPISGTANSIENAAISRDIRIRQGGNARKTTRVPRSRNGVTDTRRRCNTQHGDGLHRHRTV